MTIFDDNDGGTGLGITVVPDGVLPNGDYRLSLVLAPDFDVPSTADRFDFADWPMEVAERLRDGVVVRVAAFQNPDPIEIKVRVALPADAEQAWLLWRRLMFDEGDSAQPGAPAAGSAEARRFLQDQQNKREVTRAKIIDVAPGQEGAMVRVIAASPHALARAVRVVHAADALHALDGLRGREAAAGVRPGKALLDTDAFITKEPATAARAADAPARRREMEEKLGDQLAIGERLRTNVAEAGRDQMRPKGSDVAPDILTDAFVTRLAESYRDAFKANATTFGKPEVAFALYEPAMSPVAFGRLPGGARVLTSALSNPDVLGKQFAGYKASKRISYEEPIPDVETWGHEKARKIHYYNLQFEQRFSRRLGGIMAYPTLAKYLHLIVDLDIPRRLFEAALLGRNGGIVAATYKGMKGCPRWSGFARWAGTPHRPAYFGPISRAENQSGTPADEPDPNLRYFRGLQNLGFVGRDGQRFSLESVDADALVHATEVASRSMREEHGEGEPAHAINDALPHARTHGISLVDIMRRDRVVQSLTRSDKLGEQSNPLMAEDLTIGYRVDIDWTVGPAPGHAARWRGWRSLMERDVTLGHATDDATLRHFQATLPPVDRTREAGVLRTPVKVDTYWADPIPGGHPNPSPNNGTPPVEGVEPASGQPLDGAIGRAPESGNGGQNAPADERASVTPPLGPLGTRPRTMSSVAVMTTPPDGLKGKQPAPGDPGVAPRQVAEAIAHDTMVTWRGWSLGVPAGKKKSWCIDPRVDLPLETTIDLPTSPASPTGDRRMWPLRFGRTYRVGLRLVWLNGSGPTLAQALPWYESDRRLTLGVSPEDPMHEGPDKGFVFRRSEPVAAPDLLLSPRDPAAALLTPSEQTQTMVVRTNNAGHFDAGPHIGAVSERVLVPPAIIEELAAFHGVFDHTPGARPAGGLRHVERCGASTFPWLENGACTCPTEDQKRNHDMDDRRTVLVYRGQPKLVAPYWPDPMAVDLHWAFLHGSDPAPGYPPPGKVSFYAPGATWPNASAIRLRLHPGRRADLPQRVSVYAQAPARRWVTSLGASLQVTEAVLDIHLAEGESVELLVWCHNSNHATLNQHAAPALMAAFAKHCGEDGPSTQLRQDVCSFHDHICAAAARGTKPDDQHCVEAMLEQQPLAVLAASRRVTLVHAVARPIAPPKVIDSSLQAVPREAGGVPLELHGRIDLNRPTTSAVELRADWDEWIDGEEVRLRPDPKLPGPPTFMPTPMSATVTADTPIDLGTDPLDLELDDRGRPRSLVLALPDTRARTLSVSPVARSRFAAVFTPAAPDRALFRLAAAKPTEIKVPATKRPDMPVLLPDGATLAVRRERPAGDPGTYLLHQSVTARLLMPRGWFSSGEGELLGVLLRIVAPGEDTFEVPNKSLEPYVTRWGMDPTRLGGGPLGTGTVTAASFKGYTEAARLALPLLAWAAAQPRAAGMPPASGETAEVAVLGYVPVFDRARRLWVVDIAIDVGGSPDAFVRLGLARYQPNALSGLELSLPTNVWVAGLKPVRQVRIEIGGGFATVTVTGAATTHTYTQPADSPLGLTPVERATGLLAGTDAPLMTVRLLRGAQGRAPAPVADPETGAPMEQHQAATPDGTLSRWCAKLKLPVSWKGAGYAVQVEEREWLASDHRPTGGTVLAERGSPFHALIRLD